MRRLGREDDAAPLDAWAMVAATMRDVLAHRAEMRAETAVLRRLSPAALAVLEVVHAAGGETFVGAVSAGVSRVLNVLAGICELVDAGLLRVRMAVDEGGEESEFIVALRYDRELCDPTTEA